MCCAQCLQCVTTSDIISLYGRALRLCRVPAKCHDIWYHTPWWESPMVVQSACNVSRHLTSNLLMGESYGCAECLQCVTTLSDIIPLDGRVLRLCRVPAMSHNITWHHTSWWENLTVMQSACNVSQHHLTSYLLVGESYGCVECLQCVMTSDINTSWWESLTVVQSARNVSQHHLTLYLLMGESYGCAECLHCVTTSSDITPLGGRVLRSCRVPAMCHNIIWHYTTWWESPTVVQSAWNVSRHHLTSYLLGGESYDFAECLQRVTTSPDIIPLNGRVLRLCRVPAKCGVDCQD